ncbi:hypothetical protein KSF_006890 [Reticulibacter mediterranei]|uniref:DUF6788 domain-containing protein n=1 Tax=Reticulibacter mediterranei TaxID=2778369 RepID=A0A8J3IA06_9CHLR|nr:hypothetical protein [Reticulibacter mediterranei]GHO90641.1 hypothetical protein KSF_006890 [Reticulibacter mediterranei]
MARTRLAALIWSQADQQYFWCDEQEHGLKDTDTINVREEPEAWLKRLAATTSFSFQGREGHLTLLKEARARGGDGYWYAYRRQGKRTAKKYAGRTADLSAPRLEHMARALKCSPEQINQVPSNGDTREAGDGRSWSATDMVAQSQNSISSSIQAPLLIPKFHLPLCIPR